MSSSPLPVLAELEPVFNADEADADRHQRLNATGLQLKPIKALDQTVVNQIAAGEIIHRPANALKELIENSLDAGSTSIKITLKEGGLKVLQVQDNGSGVRPEDLPLLCQRFATSKLREFADLSNMTTFGFRGEALASLSYVCASMNVVSKTRQEGCAYKASYLNGALTPPKPGQPSAPRPCAGTDGTTITAESLFYNTPMRLRALRSAADEYNRCLDVASKYAVHYGGRGVGFVCKKASSNAADLSTPSSEKTTTLDAIRALHGSGVAKELVRLKPVKNDRLGFQVEGWRAIEAMYSGLLPKGGHPWLYISLEIEPSRIDVNVHPTKREVHFLDEEEIVESVCAHAEACLAGANTSRTFKLTQALLPGASEPASKKQRTEEVTDRPLSTQNVPVSSQRGYPQHLVRVDAKTRTLDSMFGFNPSQTAGPSSSRPVSQPSSSDPIDIEEEADEDQIDDVQGDEDEAEDEEMDLGNAPRRSSLRRGDEDLSYSSDPPDLAGQSSPPAPTQQARRPPARLQPRQRVGKRLRDSDCTLTSIRELRAEINSRRHGGMTELFQGHTFVGIAALEHGTTLVQHGTRLYMLNHNRVIEEFAYQLAIRQFGAFHEIRLEPAPSMEELVGHAVGGLTGWKEAGLKTKEDVVERVVSRLLTNAEMVAEYFSLRFDADTRTLVGVPSLLPLHGTAAVQPQRLGSLLLRLATEVDWEDEKPCFQGIARELARASIPCVDGLAVQRPGELGKAGADADAESAPSRDREEWDRQVWVVQHAWFAQMSPERCAFVAPKSLLEGGAVLQVANLPDLYRVFERC
ncbi:DNA mismatch repair protein Mlh1 [Tilletia horrida]|nr:DNA mismatch repair protein Mlh1 [Tilletia horrida]